LTSLNVSYHSQATEESVTVNQDLLISVSDVGYPTVSLLC